MSPLGTEWLSSSCARRSRSIIASLAVNLTWYRSAATGLTSSRRALVATAVRDAAAAGGNDAFAVLGPAAGAAAGAVTVSETPGAPRKRSPFPSTSQAALGGSSAELSGSFLIDGAASASGNH